MSLLENLKKANIEALKNKDKDSRTILSVVINKITTKEKEHNTTLSDQDELAIILKVNKELEEERAGYLNAHNTERVASTERQMQILSSYIPQQLTEEEIRSEIEKLSDKTLPNVMKHFKINFAGRADLSIVSKVVRQLQ